MKIAVTGKGGVGKTTIAGTLARFLAHELALLDRIQSLERSVFDGRCGCQDCNCTPDTPPTPISHAGRKHGA